jgi:hypothetical protein
VDFERTPRMTRFVMAVVKWGFGDSIKRMVSRAALIRQMKMEERKERGRITFGPCELDPRRTGSVEGALPNCHTHNRTSQSPSDKQ